jgi:hypothetical protein
MTRSPHRFHHGTRSRTDDRRALPPHRARLRRRVLSLGPGPRLARAAVAATALLSGCQNVTGADIRDCTPAFEDNGFPPGAGVTGSGAWQSSDWLVPAGESWIPLPGACLVTVPHDLGRTPALVQVYVSFVPSGQASALAAGDIARIIDVTDLDVTLRNDTLEDFFVRVVLQ